MDTPSKNDASGLIDADKAPQYSFDIIFPSKENIYEQSSLAFSFKVSFYPNDEKYESFKKDLGNKSGKGVTVKLKLFNVIESDDVFAEPRNPTKFLKDDDINYAKEFIWNIEPNTLKPGTYDAIVEHNIGGNKQGRVEKSRFIVQPNTKDTIVKLEDPPTVNKPFNVSLNETKRIETADQFLWILIRNRTVKFEKFQSFIDGVMCGNPDPSPKDSLKYPTNTQKYLYANRLPYSNVASYSLLKFATEHFLMQECGLVPTGLLDGNWSIYKNIFNNSDELGRTARGAIINVDELREEYLKELLDSEGKTHYSLPYFKLIKDKLREVQLKKPYEIILNMEGEKEAFPIDACYGILPSNLLNPCLLELIWSYWHEEGGLVQTMNAISLRFQNIRSNSGKDPLANFNLDPLRPLSNLLWGYIEDERNRLSMSRRNLEYQYEYGISLIGKAVPQIGVAEHRTNFIRAFHNLLKVTLEFYNQANFTTVIPDAFPLLNHLREVHLLLAEGAHNQYGELPWTSRVEMLTQQWLLSRPEMREFLGGRIMVPYNEAWMDKVDNMKLLQGWNDTNITHFHDLGVFGEQLLLSIRFGSWNSTTDVGALNAGNWAHYWRNEVQRYVHAYNAVTGVDLSADVTDARVQISTAEGRYTPPAILIQKQAALQKSRQQYALQGNAGTPGLLQNSPPTAVGAPSIPVLGQKKLNG
ncbi:hypothetical protein [Sabulibacter ruber]|uniref:hypothetical protein n=1 Tax=Sabulibacter ruber TaxID=2811901 RepID=UPI001A96415C|nr:hypothetical protein [Sabulibacter ruber]